MVTFLKELMRRITGFSTPLGGLSWNPSDNRTQIEAFRGTVCITSASDDGFLAFLDRASGQVVFVDIVLDACVATAEQEELVRNTSLDLDQLCAGRVSDMHLPVPTDVLGTEFIKFGLLGRRLLNLSTGGTGCLFVEVRGFFEISQTFHSGPSRTFHLRELEAPIDITAKYFARRG